MCATSVSLRPSHADLPCVSTAPVPRKELDDVWFSEDGHLVGSRERLSDNHPDIPPQLADQVGASQSAAAEVIHHRLSGAAPAEERGTRASSTGTPSCPQGRPTPHRKAHRKTDRRKKSSEHSPGPMAPHSDPESGNHACTCSHAPGDGKPPAQLRPWWSWQEGGREEPPLGQGHLLDQTIEEVSVCFRTLISSFQHI